MEKVATTGGEKELKTQDQIEYKIHHWGPLLFKTKVSLQDVKKLKKICYAATQNWGKNLAGIIKDEKLIDKKKYTDIVRPYFRAYQDAYKIWYGLHLKGVDVNAAWVNFMKKGEANPPHIHHDCHLSSVLFIDIPKPITKEQKNWKGTGSGPAALNFFTGNPQNFHTNSFDFIPEVGDFFVFPWNLTHSVAPFRSDVTRITIAANFKIIDDNIFEKTDDGSVKKKKATKHLSK